jgi:MFS family permease
MSMQGIGAALSPLLGGVVAQAFGYRVTFLLLGAISIGSLVLWCRNATLLRHHESARLADGRASRASSQNKDGSSGPSS